MASVVVKDVLLFDPNTDPTRTSEEYRIQDANNIYPTFNGYRTGWGYSWLSRFTYSVGIAPLAFKVLQDGVSAIIVTNNAIYHYNFITDYKTIIYIFASVPTESTISIAYIGTYWYVLIPNRGLIKVDMINLTGTQVVLPPELPYEVTGELVHITTTDNRLILLTEKVVAHTAVGDGSDFVTSTATGAGWVTLDSLSKGRGLAVEAKSNGFLIFTTTNVITVRELDTALIYSYESVLSSILYNPQCVVGGNEGVVYFLDTRLNLYSYIDKSALGGGGLQLVSQTLTNFFINYQITPIKLVLLDYDLLVVTNKGVYGVETLTKRLFKFSSTNHFFGEYAFDSQFNLFQYNRDYQHNTEVANDAAYFGTRLRLGNEVRADVRVFNASVEFFSELPYYDNAISKTIVEGDLVFSGYDYIHPPIEIWYIDLNVNATFDEDLNNSALVVDLNNVPLTTGATVEISGQLIQVQYKENYKQTPIKAHMTFGSLNFSPEIPIECATVLTRIDTMVNSIGTEYFIDCRVGEPGIKLIDCSVAEEPDIILRGDLVAYDIKITDDASTDSKGQLGHHQVVIEDKYYVGDRLVGNLYNTGVYHRVRYDIDGACEVKGVQFNMFKGGLVYDRTK